MSVLFSLPFGLSANGGSAIDDIDRGLSRFWARQARLMVFILTQPMPLLDNELVVVVAELLVVCPFPVVGSGDDGGAASEWSRPIVESAKLKSMRKFSSGRSSKYKVRLLNPFEHSDQSACNLVWVIVLVVGELDQCCLLD